MIECAIKNSPGVYFKNGLIFKMVFEGFHGMLLVNPFLCDYTKNSPLYLSFLRYINLLKTPMKPVKYYLKVVRSKQKGGRNIAKVKETNHKAV